ncbi:MAG TPA: formate dehydrogenase subunit delta [Halothiobacillus sp.]|nr:formate dehydrogenase subunit delta [Halothiobacillus sp.]
MNNLVHMANKIGVFFEAMPDHNDALRDIVDHLHKFWEPRMRRQLLAYLDSENGKDLLPIVVEAIHTHRNQLSQKNQSI